MFFLVIGIKGMAKLQFLKKALEILQSSMVERNPPLLVAKDQAEVNGIASMFPQLKSYTVSQEQFQRSNMAKNWQGTILFLNGEYNEATKKNDETSSSLCESDRGKLQVHENSSKEPRSEEPKPTPRQHLSSVQEKQVISKTGKK